MRTQKNYKMDQIFLWVRAFYLGFDNLKEPNDEFHYYQTLHCLIVVFMANPVNNIRSREYLIPLRTKPGLTVWPCICFACAATS